MESCLGEKRPRATRSMLIPDNRQFIDLFQQPRAMQLPDPSSPVKSAILRKNYMHRGSLHWGPGAEGVTWRRCGATALKDIEVPAGPPILELQCPT